MLQTGRYTEIPVVSRSVSGVSIRGEFIAVSADSGLHCKKSPLVEPTDFWRYRPVYIDNMTYC